MEIMLGQHIVLSYNIDIRPVKFILMVTFSQNKNITINNVIINRTLNLEKLDTDL
jgi:hypothetical protein